MLDLSKKSEKLASAIYLITSFFNDQEPVKWRLRTLAAELVSLDVSIKDNLYGKHESAVLRKRNLASEIISFLAVAKNAGLVSDINHSILHQELIKYLDMFSLPPTISEENGRVALTSNFFEIKPEVSESVEKPAMYISRDKEVSKVSEHFRPVLPTRTASADKGQNLKEFGAVSVKKNSRQSIIISVLKRKKEVMIKDITPLISWCSEKTIQRELSSMVQSGVLRKTGEKRWSKYSLA